MDNLISFNEVTMNYIMSTRALNSISCELTSKSLICGTLGSGKSAMLRCIAGLEKYYGTIVYKGKDIASIELKDRNFSYTFPLNSLDKWSTVEKNLRKPFKIRKLQVTDEILKIAEDFNITDLLKVKVYKLNYKDKIKLLYARQFVLERDLHIIDLQYAEEYEEILCLIREIISNKNYIAAATSPLSICADNIVVLQKGSVSYNGKIEDVNSDINNIYLARLFKIEFNKGTLVKEEEKYYVIFENGEKKTVNKPFSDIFVGKIVYECRGNCYDLVSEKKL